MMTRQANWTAFLYLLMRDEVPLGTIARIVQAVEKNSQQDFKYTNNGLHSSALDFVQRMDSI